MGECLPVLVRHIFQRIAYLVDNAALVFSLRICGSYCFLNPSQSVRTKNQDILDAPVAKLIQHGQPILCAFILADLNGQHFLPALAVDSQNNVCCQLPDYIAVTNRVVDGVNEHHWIDFAQRPLLPLFYLRQQLIRYVRDEAL